MQAVRLDAISKENRGVWRHLAAKISLCRTARGIFHAPENKAFVTCDRPFSIVPPRGRKSWVFRGVGIATAGAWKLMPLSMGRCLAIGDPGGVVAYSDLDANGVRQTNLNTCHGAYRWVIGCDRELVDSLAKEVQRVLAERGVKWGGSKMVIG